jgi:hypothetical protein
MEFLDQVSNCKFSRKIVCCGINYVGEVGAGGGKEESDAWATSHKCWLLFHVLTNTNLA